MMRKISIFCCCLWMILNVCDAQRKIEIPDYSRPRMEYVKVQFNCVDKSIYKSNNPRLKLFYEEVNNHLNVFLKLIKMNVMTIEEFQETSRNLRDEYISFQKNFTESALNCTNWLSYKNLNATVNSTIIILDFISNLNEQQYKGLGKESMTKCLNKHYNYVMWCTEKNIKWIAEPVYRPKNDPNVGKPARPVYGRKEYDLPFTARCGTGFSEMMSCSKKGLEKCASDDREKSLSIIKSLIKYAELEKPACYDLQIIATFDVMLQKLHKVK